MRADEAQNSLKVYLKEISATPLLTREEEVDLSIKIQAGDLAARERMIKSNLRLVVKIAQDYSNYGLPLVDLISEGNVGLMKAVERFDPERKIDMLIFLWDPLKAQPHDPDVKALLRLATVWDIPIATNISTAEALLKSEILSKAPEHKDPNFSTYLNRFNSDT